MNFLKGALYYSDFITTVSRKYAQEIQTAEYGFGLEGVLRQRAATVSGILEWRRLRRVESGEGHVHCRAAIAADLEKSCRANSDLLNASVRRTPEPKSPVIGIVSRFAAQKGFDLIANIADRLARDDLILVALGSGDKPYEEMFRRLNRQFRKKFR